MNSTTGTAVCPNCDNQRQVPVTADRQMARCNRCGERFRIRLDRPAQPELSPEWPATPDVAQPPIIVQTQPAVSYAAQRRQQSGCLARLFKMAFLVVVGTVGLALLIAFTDKPKTAAERESENKHLAYVHAQQVVVRNLRAPSTADFGWQMAEGHVERNPDGHYVCWGFVDAQNGFGAQIRSEWRVVIELLPGDKYQVHDVVID